MAENREYTIHRLPIYLGKSREVYQLVLFEDKNEYSTLVNILKYNDGFKTWQCLYSTTLPFVGVKMYNHLWDLTGDIVLVLYSPPEGSGGFISYRVIGLDESKIREYISQDTLFQGSLFFQRNKLVQGIGNQFKVWVKEDDKYVLKHYSMPLYPGAIVIRYKITGENTVILSKDTYRIPLNGIVQFIRDDDNDYTERIMFPGDCTEYIKISIFKINCKGKHVVTIIPSAYNWDAAKEVYIIAE